MLCTISADRKTLTLTLANPIPQSGDDAVNLFFEQESGTATVRYIDSTGIGVMRGYLAASNGQFPNLETLIFELVGNLVSAQIGTYPPPAILPLIAAAIAAQQAVQTAIRAAMAEQVLLS